jgi:hypothetical protein
MPRTEVAASTHAGPKHLRRLRWITPLYVGSGWWRGTTCSSLDNWWCKREDGNRQSFITWGQNLSSVGIRPCVCTASLRCLAGGQEPGTFGLAPRCRASSNIRRAQSCEACHDTRHNLVQALQWRTLSWQIFSSCRI